ncbi:MAG: hypothetical protein WD751_03935 [Anaerolineales bacterium]
MASPIHVVAEGPPWATVVRVDLRGRDGRLLARKLLLPAARGRFDFDLDFEISRPAEAGRLLVGIEDGYGRLAELTSIEVELVAEGEGGGLLPSQPIEIFIEAPAAGEAISGGSIMVSGSVRGLVARPLTVQLITRQGRVLASDNVYPSLDATGSGSFELEMAYHLDEAEWVLVSVSQQTDGVTIVLSSAEVLLEP